MNFILNLQNVAFRNNTAADDGAAIFSLHKGEINITGCEFSSNTSSTGGSIIEAWEDTLHVQGSEFFNNTGVTMVVTMSDVTVHESMFTNNIGGRAVQINGEAGMYFIEDSSFIGNTGGGIYLLQDNNTTTIRRNLFSQNSAATGGAIVIYYGSPTGSTLVENNTFYDNHGDIAGAIYANGTNVIRNNTFVQNKTITGTGQIFFDAPSTAELNNNIFYGAIPDCGSRGTVTVTGGNNLTDYGAAICRPSVFGEPLLGPLADNGGPTQTMALLAGSPAIDAGSNAHCPETDQRGIIRPRGLRCDIGAFESDMSGPTNTPTRTASSTITRTPTRTGTPTRTSTPTPTVTNTLQPWIVVMNTADSGPGSLRQAVADVSDGGTITFDPSIAGQTITLASTIDILRSMTMDGSGIGARVEISGDNLAGIFTIDNASSVIIKSLVLKNGRSESPEGGSALFISGFSQVTLQDSVLHHNHGYQAGAIMAFSDSQLTVDHCEFTANSSETFAGAIFASGAALTIRNSIFTANEAVFEGGALILDLNTTFIIEDSAFIGNVGTDGGAIFIPQITGQHVSLRRNLFSGNVATTGGGGAVYYAVFTPPADPVELENNTFYNNQAGQGGAVYAAGNAIFQNNTFSGNTAAVSGASIYFGNQTHNTLYNNIIANGAGDAECWGEGSVDTDGYGNLVEDGSAMCRPTSRAIRCSARWPTTADRQ